MKISKEQVISDYYENYFQKLCYAGVQNKGTRTFHRLIEKNWTVKSPSRILEVGAGVGEHFPFVPREAVNNLKEYVALDIRKPQNCDKKFIGKKADFLVTEKLVPLRIYLTMMNISIE